MITLTLKDAYRLYNSVSYNGEFISFIKKIILSDTCNIEVPDFVRKAFEKLCIEVKTEIILKGADDTTIVKSIKKFFSRKKNKKESICLIKYVYPLFLAYLSSKKRENKEFFLEVGGAKIKIYKFKDPWFRFTSEDPVLEVKFNRKTKAVKLVLVSGVDGDDLDLPKVILVCRVLDFKNVSVLKFMYHISRIYSSQNSSDYEVEKVFYISKDPFYVVESKKKVFYNCKESKSLFTLSLEEMIKKFEPNYSKDRVFFRKVILPELATPVVSIREEKI
ncbi:MAG: hypothetical protein QW735_03250 [archaeon]